MPKLTIEDIIFFKRYSEVSYKEQYDKDIRIRSADYRFRILDVVKIVNIGHDFGYEGQLGIVYGMRGNDSYYVYSYDKLVERYWACGIEGNYLVGTDKKFEDTGELYEAFRKYLFVNKFELGTSYFKEEWERFKLREKSYKKDNVIYVDFT